MKKYILVILTIFMILGTISCQATPEEETVVQKDFNPKEVIEMQETSEIKPYDCPDSWEEKIETGINNFSIEINAKINIPESGFMPLSTIVYKDIESQMARKIVNILFDGKKIYSGDGIKTKDEIEQEILKEQAKFTDPNSIINSQETEDMKELKKAVVEETIQNLKEQLITAPEESNKKEVTEFEEVRGGTWGFAGASIEDSDATKGIVIMKYENNLMNNILYSNLVRGTNIRVRSNTPWSNILLDDQKNYENLLGIEMSMEDAKSIADEKVLATAGEDYSISDIGSARVKNLESGGLYEFPQCYLFRYTRKVNDAQITYDNTVYTSGEYSQPRGYESISVAVDDSGIIVFEWIAPCEIKEILSERVELIEFDKMQEIFRNQISVEGVFQEDYNVQSKSIVIDEARLGLMSISQENNSEEYILVPVWDFYGYTKLQYNNQEESQLPLDENNTFTYRNYQYSYLTINAIDGSIIDRSLGY